MNRYFNIVVIIVAVLAMSVYDGSAEKVYRRANGIEGATTSQDVKVFPNPVQNQSFTIDAGHQLIREIRISNIAGVVVSQKQFPSPVSQHQVTISQIPNGIYLLRIVFDNQQARTVKLLVRNQ